ncbi:MAG: hypothetical protein GY803_13310 [Chloroflexi bacterium]|nr:hypothetical protein [Chloroflexota bacterium]
MSRHRRWLRTAVLGALAAAALVACQAQQRPPTTVTVTRIVVETAVPETILVAAVVEPEETATSEPPPRKDLVVCVVQEPVTLYPFGSSLPVETAVLHAIFENDYTALSYDIQPQGLAAIPNLNNGDADLSLITAQAGDMVVDATGDVSSLAAGMTIVTSAGEEVVFDGAPVEMNQLVVDFAMKQRYWADGEPVTAADSVYSFQLDANPDTPTDKFVVARTASYEATGDLSVRWVGLPGFRDADYAIRFWKPLPRHLWSRHTATELLTAKISSRYPLGDGPFILTEWVAGDYLRLEPNLYYYRSDEELPRLDSITFRFLPDVDQLVSDLLVGECDVATPSDLDMSHAPLLLAAEANGLIRPYFQPGTVYEHIDFGINSWQYYGDGDGRPDWFEDVRVRQAMTMCTDRQGMMDELLNGRSQLIHSYIPSDHPLYPDDLAEWPYDVQAANALLDAVGYLDHNGDGIRQDALTDTSFRVTLGAGANVMQQQITQQFREDMRDCGIEVQTYYLPPEEWYASGPDGPLFGRHFDLGEFAWMAQREPSCFLYASWEITGPDTEINRAAGRPYGDWDAANGTGWWDLEYDDACQTAHRNLPGTPAYEKAHREAQRIFAQNLPVIPLFLRLKVVAAQPHVSALKINPTQPSALWNLYEIDMQE